jgi:hypothetical protein
MHLQILTPFMTGISVSAILLLCRRSHHKVSADGDTFTVAPVVAYFMMGVGLLICSVPFVPGVAGDISSLSFFWELSPFWLLAFVASAFFFCYRVIVRDKTLIYGAFRRNVIPFSEVIDFDVIEGRRSSELWVYLKNGNRLKFSGMLGDFDELVDKVEDQMAGLPGEQRDSPAKIHDQEKRKRDNRDVAWFSYGGLLIVAVFAFIVWRLRLL